MKEYESELLKSHTGTESGESANLQSLMYSSMRKLQMEYRAQLLKGIIMCRELAIYSKWFFLIAKNRSARIMYVTKFPC